MVCSEQPPLEIQVTSGSLRDGDAVYSAHLGIYATSADGTMPPPSNSHGCVRIELSKDLISLRMPPWMGSARQCSMGGLQYCTAGGSGRSGGGTPSADPGRRCPHARRPNHNNLPKRAVVPPWLHLSIPRIYSYPASSSKEDAAPLSSSEQQVVFRA